MVCVADTEMFIREETEAQLKPRLVKPSSTADQGASGFLPNPGKVEGEESALKLGHTPLIINEGGVLTPSELDARLKCDHARRVVAAQAYSEQPCGGRGGVSECAKPRLS